MLTFLKNKLSDGGQVVYDYLFPETAKEFLKQNLSDERKKQLRRLLGAGRQQVRVRKINEAKYRLKNLGFQTEGYREMNALFQQSDDRVLKELAGWELALWHADQYNEEDAKSSLAILNQLKTDKLSSDQLRRRTILKVENLHLLGHTQEAKKTLKQTLSSQQHPDLYLAYANLELTSEDKLNWINKALDCYQINAVYLSDQEQFTVYDQLQSTGHTIATEQLTAKVTVIIPVYNAGEEVRTAIDSILKQTWSNIEVFVVDDCSTDQTETIVKQYEQRDQRIKFLKTPQNSGPYVARNIALQHATGDFVTINDADDWSHPQKLEKQVLHLLKNKNVMGNTSEQARATENLDFFRRGKPGEYIFSNMSSFMFRREAVLDKLGYWDSVRFAADSEFILRIKKVFGAQSVVELPIGPLSFQRQSANSLTGNSAFGYPGFFMGIRKEYREAQIDYHQKASSFYYSFPQKERPFKIPDPLLPNREVAKGEQRYFEQTYIADFRSSNPNLKFVIEDLLTYVQSKQRVALVQMYTYTLPPESSISHEVRDLMNNHSLQVVCYGEVIRTKKCLIQDISLLNHKQIYLPKISAEQIEVRSQSTASEKLDNLNWIKEYFEGPIKMTIGERN